MSNEEVAETAAASPPSEEETVNVQQVLHGTKVDGGRKSVWAMTRETFGMADGKQEKEDIICETIEEAMRSLEGMLQEVKEEHPKWQFTLTPLAVFSATHETFLKAFVIWAKKDDDNDEDTSKINVSKAFRRLDAYATWMENHRTELEEPLTVESVRAAAHAWQCKITVDCKNRLVWWLDIAAMDVLSIKRTITPIESLRFIVWMSHLIMLDPNAQENGLLMVEAMGAKGMMATLTLVPMDIGTKLDRLTIGVIPTKMKAVYVFNHQRWISILMGVMKPFMSKKLRGRIFLIPKTSEPQTVLEEEIGKDFILSDFAGLQGKLEEDIIFGTWIK